MQSSGSIAGVVGVPQNTAQPNSFIWSGSADNTWENSANWSLSSGTSSSTIPDGLGMTATFGTAGAASNAVLNTGHTVSGLTFLAAVSTTVGGTGTLTFASTTGGASIGAAGTNTISAPMALAVATSANVGSGGELTLSGAISGSGGLTASGIGLLVLAGSNTFTGGTVLGSGSLSVSDLSNLAGSAGSLAFNGGTLIVTGTSMNNLGGLAVAGNAYNLNIANAANQFTLAQSLSGPSTLHMSGPGTLVLTGNNTHTGGTTINSGVLQVGNGAASGGLSGAVTNNGTLAFNQPSGYVFSGSVSGVGSLVQMGPGVLYLTGANTHSGGTTINPGAELDIGNGGASGSLTGGVLNNGTLAFNRADAVNYSGAISGSGGVLVNGGGTLTLSGQQTYGGATTVLNGTLRLPSAGNLGAVAYYSFGDAAGTTVPNDGNGGSSMNGTLNGAAAIVNDPTRGPVLSLNGAAGSYVAINSPITDLSGSGSWTVSAWINTTQSGATILNKGNGSTWATGFSTFYLQNGNDGGGTAMGAVRYSGGWLSGTANVANGQWNFVTISDNAGTRTIYVNGAVDPQTQTQFTTFDTGTVVRLGWTPGDDGSTFFNGEMSDVGIYSTALTAQQIQSLYLGSGGSNALPSTTALIVNSGATFDLDGNNQTVASLSDGTLGGGTITNNGSQTSVLTVANSGNTTFSGLLSDGPASKLSLTMAGPGTLSLFAANTFSGTTTINQGAIRLGNVLALQNSTVDIQLANGLDLGGFNATLGALGGPGDLAFGAATLLTVGGNNDSTTYSGSLNGNGSLVKTGSGVMAVVGASAYTGTTTISGGALQADDGAGLPAASFLVLDGGVLASNSPVAFTRPLGTNGSAVEWTANGGGFAAVGGAMTVNIGGNGSTLTWGNNVGSQIVGTLKLSSSFAQYQTLVVNPIDLGGQSQTVEVDYSPNPGAYATLSGG